MKLNFKRNKAPKLPNKVTRAEYNDLVEFLNMVIIKKHNDLSHDFYELREELATNGVVRDLRKAEKEIKQLRVIIENVDQFVVTKFNELHTNGVATAINKLNKEVFETKKDRKSNRWDVGLLSAILKKEPMPQDATLAGKVDAIIAHLGLEVTVEPEKKTVVPAKAVATKVKAPAKKKGRR